MAGTSKHVFLVALGLRCCSEAFWQEGLPFVAVHGFLTAVAPLVAEHRLQAEGSSKCGTQALVALWHTESSQTRDRTHVPCISRRTLILRTTPGKSESKLFLVRTVAAHTSETGQIASEQQC